MGWEFFVPARTLIGVFLITLTSLTPNLSVKNENHVLAIFTFYLPRYALRP
jgi:hypothetical protein